MAQVSFDVANEIEMSRAQNQSNGFSFFSLRNDGDEAIVRFIYDNTSQFQIFTVHDVTINSNGRETTRKISCLRNPRDPIDMCPLCKSDKSSRNVFLIQMLQYTVDPNTNSVSMKPVIWERSMTYANRIKSLIDEYGPLSDCIFKIKRCGAAGSRDTTYEIYYGNPRMYPDDVFVKDFSVFDNVNLLGTIIMDKNFDEIESYLRTGSFPVTRNDDETMMENRNSYSNASKSTENSVRYVPKESVNTEQYIPFNNGQQRPRFDSMPPVNMMNNNDIQNVQPVTYNSQNNNSVNTPPQRAVRYY